METTLSLHKKILNDFYETVWLERDIYKAADFIHNDMQYHSPRMKTEGKNNYLEMVRAYMSVLSNTKYEILKLIEEEDTVFVHMEFTGKHTGPFGSLPPTNKELTFELMAYLQFQDGKIIDEKEIFDEFGFKSQLGLRLTMNNF